MSHGKSDAEIIKSTHNTARFFVEKRHVAWVLLIATCIWGIYGYFKMPQRKDPEVQIRMAVALIPWRGASAEKVEQLVTKKVEEQMAANTKVTKIESISRTGLAVVYLELDEKLKETAKELDDIKLRLDGIHDLPSGAGPINFIKDFGDTAALMLTVSSPKADETEIAMRAKAIKEVIEQERAKTPNGNDPSRFTLVLCGPRGGEPRVLRTVIEMFLAFTKEKAVASDVHVLYGDGFVGFDGISDRDDAQLLDHVQQFVNERLQASEFHPDAWQPTVVRNPADTQAKLTAVAGDKYSFRQMDEFTEVIEKTLKTDPVVSKVSRAGLLNEAVYLLYSQERLAAYGIQAGTLEDVLKARNISTPGGQVNVEGKNVTLDPAGEFKSENEIGDVLIPSTSKSPPVYLRDLVDVVRGYESPARYLNYFNWQSEGGQWHRSRAVTLSVQMRSGEQIGVFGQNIDVALEKLRSQLPSDLIFARTSDQPLQVEESIDLFMKSLWEAIGLVVIVALIGFWEWRSALLMALSIPLTLAMTFGMMHILGIDLQQVSIATLIIALGLLVDDPVVAGDAIKRDLALGHKPIIASWLGPTKLATAILYATITNIVAYLPFMIIKGSSGEFIYSLPVVLACSLIASRVVSMSFIPLLSYYLLKPKFEKPVAERRTKGFAAQYYKLGTWAIDHRWRVMAGALVFLVLGGVLLSRLKTEYFPKDLSYLSYVDVWLPEDAPLAATNEAAAHAEQIIREVATEYGKHHADGDHPREVLKSLTTFVGGGGPRFWFSISPELQQLNYAQIIIQLNDKHDTSHLVEPLQRELSARIPGARIDVRQLELGKGVGLPVAIRLSGTDAQALRDYAERVKQIFKKTEIAERVRDDWGEESFAVRLKTDSDRANSAGITNLDVAMASLSATAGQKVTSLRDGDKEIPVLARMRMEERSQLGDLQNLYVYSREGNQKILMSQIAGLGYGMQTEKIRSRNQFRTITVSAMPASGRLASEIMSAAKSDLKEFEQQLPPGYRMEIGGEQEDQVKGFKDQTVVMLISVTAIFLALVFQFKNAIKPFIVFAAVPFGMLGGLAALWIMGTPFGFMAFLGMISLVGVIVSHIIVLFDFIEEKHLEGAPLVEALLDAGIMRLRPVMITVGATVIALFPLASHGGPLWQPMCYAQIGGLSVATFVTLLLVPVIYAIFVFDLKLVKWDRTDSEPAAESLQPQVAATD